MELLEHIGLPDLVFEPAVLTQYLNALWAFSVLLTILFALCYLQIFMSRVFPMFPEVTKSIKIWLVRAFWELCFYFIDRNNIKIEIHGSPEIGDSGVIICNHQSLLDFIALSFLRRTVTKEKLLQPKLLFFTWATLWEVPNPKLISHMGKYNENWELDPSLCSKSLNEITDVSTISWIALLPEINIFTERDRRWQSMYGEKYYLPKLMNLLYPRFSGFYNVLQYVHNEVPKLFDSIYDITIIYLRKGNPDVTKMFSPPTLFEAFSKSVDITIQVHVSIVKISKVPIKRKDSEKWLEKRWILKDTQIEQLKDQILQQESANKFSQESQL